MVCRLNSFSSSSLMRAQTPSPKSAVGHDHAAPSGLVAAYGRRSFRMMS